MLNNSIQSQTAILPKKPKPGAERFNVVSQDPPVERNRFAAMFASLAEQSEATEPQVPPADNSPDDVSLDPSENKESESETGLNGIGEDAALASPPSETDPGSKIRGDDADLPRKKEFFQEPSSGGRRENQSSQTPSEPGKLIGVASEGRAQDAGAHQNPVEPPRDPVRGRGGSPAADMGLAADPKTTVLSGPSGSAETGETISLSSSAAGSLFATQAGSTGNARSEWNTGGRKQDGNLPQSDHALSATAALSAGGREVLDRKPAIQSGLSKAEMNLSAQEIGPQDLAPNVPTGSSQSKVARSDIPFGQGELPASESGGNKTSAGLQGTIKLATVPDAAAKPFATDASAFFSEMFSETSAIGGKDPANVLPSQLESGWASSSMPGLDYGTARAVLVRNAAAQAVEVIVRKPGKPVEISLNPEELGRVRMALTTTESGVTVVITSERPETLDLMRRHIDQLAQEFLRLGYENTAFEFSSDTGNDNPAARILPNVAEDENGFPNADKTLHPITSRLVSTGLDLRL